MNPFYLDLGFTLVEIAEVRKIFGVVMTMVGVFAGGFAVARYGLMRALVIGAFAGPLSNLVFVWLATRGHDVFALFVAIGVDNVTVGLCRDLSDRLHVRPDVGRVHRDAVRALVVALRDSRSHHRVAVGTDRRGRGTGRRGGRRAGGAEAVCSPDCRRRALPAPSSDRASAPPRSAAVTSCSSRYSALIGILPIVLALAVLRRQGRRLAS